MDQIELKELKKAVKHELNNRSNHVKKLTKRRKLYLKSKPFFAAIAAFCSLIVVIEWSKGNFRGVIEGSLMALAFLCGLCSVHINSLEAPKDPSAIDAWLWKNTRKDTFFQFVGLTCVLLALWTPKGNASNYFFVLSWLSLLVILLDSLIVFWKPHLFLSNLLNQISLIASFIAFPSLLLSFILRPWSVNPVFVRSVGLLLTIVSILVVISIVMTLKSKELLTPLQYAAIRCVPPDRLMHSLQTHSELFALQIEALNIVSKLEDKAAYGLQLALLEVLAKKHQPRHNILSFLLSGIIVIAGLLVPLLFQDFIYIPIVKPLLCAIMDIFCGP